MIPFSMYINESSDSDLKKLGSELGVDWGKTDFDQFKMGIEVEKEHTRGRFIAVRSLRDVAKIALAHLDEMPDYYTKLKKMEEGK